jgi:hypothetical protein
VDVSKPSVPACPLTIAYPSLSEANHPATIGIDTIAEVEVLYLYLMLARYDGSNDVLVLADGGEGRISSSILHNTYATLALITRSPLVVRASGC